MPGTANQPVAPKPEVAEETIVRTICSCWGSVIVVVVLAKHFQKARCWGCGKPLLELTELR